MEWFRRIIGILNIVLGSCLLILLHFIDVPDVFSSIMVMSLFVGWIFPYIALIISGIGILIKSNYLITLLFSIINILVIIFMIFLVGRVYSSKFLIVIIEYIIMLVLTIVNIVYLIMNKDEIIRENYKRNYLD